MSFAWLKHYMPRGLYWRAGLILALPVLVVQAVVTVLFLQRHFEEVTEQLTIEAARDITLYISLSAQEPRAPILLERNLGLKINDYATTKKIPATSRAFYDLTGLVIERVLTEQLSSYRAVEFIGDHSAIIWLRLPDRVYAISLSRDRLSATNPHQLFVNMGFFSILVTLIAYFYLRNQLRPITRLAQAAEAFGRGQRVSYSPSGATEVRAAGTAFLDMRARIERHIEQRTQMLSGVSHDLRTPLTRMKLGLDMMEDPMRDELKRDVKEMEELLNGFLEFTKGAAQSDPAERTLLPEYLDAIITDAKRANLSVCLAECTADAQAMIRPMLLRRAVDNLIANAVRYGTRAEISARLKNRILTVTIEDDGPGIPKEKREEALRPFARLDPARNQNKGSGVGLGLAIAADAARAHGGVLRLEDSTRLGGLRAELVIACS